MKKIFFAIALSIGAISFANAQVNVVGQPAHDKPEDVLGYNPDIILNDWKNWEQEQTTQNAFIATFMTEHNVPTTGLYGLTKHNTWMWWISNNQEAIAQYLELREENGLE